MRTIKHKNPRALYKKSANINRYGCMVLRYSKNLVNYTAQAVSSGD